MAKFTAPADTAKGLRTTERILNPDPEPKEPAISPAPPLAELRAKGPPHLRQTNARWPWCRGGESIRPQSAPGYFREHGPDRKMLPAYVSIGALSLSWVASQADKSRR